MPTKTDIYTRAVKSTDMRNPHKKKNRAPKYALVYRRNILAAIVDNSPKELFVKLSKYGTLKQFCCEVELNGEHIGRWYYNPGMIECTVKHGRYVKDVQIVDPNCGNEAAHEFFQWLEAELQRKKENVSCSAE